MTLVCQGCGAAVRIIAEPFARLRVTAGRRYEVDGCVVHDCQPRLVSVEKTDRSRRVGVG